MSNVTVTEERIAHLMETAEVDVKTIFDKCTVMAVQLENGFVIVESSACVDPANYDPKLGRKFCADRITDKLWELEGYALQKSLYERRNVKCGCGQEASIGDFGWALNRMRRGDKVRRRGWNGKGIFIQLQVPDEHSKMTSPYFYIDTTGLQTNNPESPKSCVPWFPSQTDLMAEDWELFNCF